MVSPAVAAAIRELLAARAQATVRGQRPVGTKQAVVTAVTQGAAQDGNHQVTVNYLGTDVSLPYGASYAPAVGDVVVINVDGPNLSIQDKLIGTPSPS